MTDGPTQPGEPGAPKPRRTAYIAIGTALGVSVGAGLGVATDNLAMWMGAGIGAGVAIGAGLDAAAQKKAAGPP